MVGGGDLVPGSRVGERRCQPAEHGIFRCAESGGIACHRRSEFRRLVVRALEDQKTHLEQSRALVELPVSDQTLVSGKLPQDRRYCRPWTREFVQDFGKDYFAAWRQPIQVTSAVRTVLVQKKLRRHNRNAAPISGEDSSPHMTGAAIDIAKAGMSREQLNWVRNYLLQKQSTGNIDVEEEFRQRVFHISVYKSYSDSKLILPVKEVQTAEPLPAPEGIEH